MQCDYYDDRRGEDRVLGHLSIAEGNERAVVSHVAAVVVEAASRRQHSSEEREGGGTYMAPMRGTESMTCWYLTGTITRNSSRQSLAVYNPQGNQGDRAQSQGEMRTWNKMWAVDGEVDSRLASFNAS